MSNFTETLAQPLPAAQNNVGPKDNLLYTIPKFAQKHSNAFSERRLRYFVVTADENGLTAARAFVRVGKLIFIDEARFMEWVYNPNRTQQVQDGKFEVTGRYVNPKAKVQS